MGYSSIPARSNWVPLPVVDGSWRFKTATFAGGASAKLNNDLVCFDRSVHKWSVIQIEPGLVLENLDLENRADFPGCGSKAESVRFVLLKMLLIEVLPP